MKNTRRAASQKRVSRRKRGRGRDRDRDREREVWLGSRLGTGDARLESFGALD